MNQELLEKAKGLGIKSAHLYKDEEKLKAKIAEAEKETLEVLSEDEYPVEEIKPFRVAVEESQKEMSKPDGGKYEYMVKSGKVLIRGKRYVSGEKLRSDKANLDKRFEVVKV